MNIESILQAARDCGADAVHPGYGFLSENPDFAEACAAAGIVFIGPPASAMRTMGSKAEAKDLMQRHGVPLVPGYHGADQNPARLLDEAEQIGFPVLIKASAGGGGRGMRVVGSAAEFAAALATGRIPRPPPPNEALMRTGKPIRSASSSSRAGFWSAP